MKKNTKSYKQSYRASAPVLFNITLQGSWQSHPFRNLLCDAIEEYLQAHSLDVSIEKIFEERSGIFLVALSNNEKVRVNLKSI